MEEIIKREIPGYPGYYATSDGKIIGLRGKELSPAKSGDYQRVTLYVNKKGHRIGVHQAIALAFHENDEDLPVVNHLDNCGTNNSPDNLEWTTYEGNALHAQKIKATKAAHVQSIEIIDKKTGISKVYPSMVEAAKAVGKSKEFIRRNIGKDRSDYIIRKYFDDDNNYAYFAQMSFGTAEHMITRLVYNQAEVDYFKLGSMLQDEGYNTIEILKAIETLTEKKIISCDFGKVKKTVKLHQYMENLYGGFVIEAPLS